MVLNVRELPKVKLRGVTFYFKAPNVEATDPERQRWNIYSISHYRNRPVMATVGVKSTDPEKDDCWGHLITPENTEALGDTVMFSKHETKLLLAASFIRYASLKA